jgi:hypothetical protein
VGIIASTNTTTSTSIIKMTDSDGRTQELKKNREKKTAQHWQAAHQADSRKTNLKLEGGGNMGY